MKPLIGTGRKSGRGISDVAKAIGSELRDKKVLSSLLRKLPGMAGRVSGTIASDLGFGKKIAKPQARRAKGQPRRVSEMFGGAQVGQYTDKPINRKFFPGPYAPASGAGSCGARRGKGFFGDLLGTVAGFLPGPIGKIASPIVHTLAGKIGLGSSKKTAPTTRGGVTTYGGIMY